MNTILRRIRLLPLVIVVGFVLLTVKSFGLLREAQAESAGGAMPTEQSDPAAATPTDDPAADDTEMASAAEVDVLTSLTKRRKQLDQRELDLAMRQNVITAAEQRVDTKITQLQALQAEIQKLLGQRDAEEQKQIASLVKTYSAMKAKDAARIFDTLDTDVRIAVAQQMKSDVLAPILAAMQADQAQKITVALANRLKVTPPPVTAAASPAAPAPDGTQPTPAPITTASNTPATTTPPAAAPTPTPTTTQPPAKAPEKSADATPPAKTPDKTADATPKPAPAVHKPRPKLAAAKPPVKTAATDTAPTQTAALNSKSAAAAHAPPTTTAPATTAPATTAPASGTTPAAAAPSTAAKPGG